MTFTPVSIATLRIEPGDRPTPMLDTSTIVPPFLEFQDFSRGNGGGPGRLDRPRVV